MRRVAIAVVGLLIAVVILLYGFRGRIAAEVMERGLVSTLSADPIAELRDGVRVGL